MPLSELRPNHHPQEVGSGPSYRHHSSEFDHEELVAVVQAEVVAMVFSAPDVPPELGDWLT